MGKQKPELPRLLPEGVVMRDGYPWAFHILAMCELPLSIEQARQVLEHALTVLSEPKSVDQIDAVSRMRVPDIDPLGR